MLSRDDLDYIRQHPAGKVKLALTDIDGILRGKYISTEKFLACIEAGAGFCDVVFGWDASDVVYDNTRYTGWHTGYPDAPIRLVPETFRRIPWENDVPFFLAEMADRSGEPQDVCPRQLLRKIIGNADAAGFKVYCSEEFEWFNFLETPKGARDKRYDDLTPISPGMFGYSILRTTLNNPYFTDLFEMLRRFNVPLEGLHTETGPGVLEAAIQYAEAMEAADRAVLFKTAVKEIAYNHHIMATFMAKVHEQLPGCGGHVHQSLWDKDGKTNLFHNPGQPGEMSGVMESYLAGQLHCLSYILPMYAPNINSYKRLVEGAWAPTNLTWGMDNRTVAIRAICRGSKSARIETRVIGADVNPYLAMSAAIGSGLYGISHGLKLTQAAVTGNGYRDVNAERLPSTLWEATQQMKNAPIAAEIFGSGFVEHFVQTREWEWREHLKPVTDWERSRYFEII